MSSISATSPFVLARPPLTLSLEAEVLVRTITSWCSSLPVFLTENVTLPALTLFGLALVEYSSSVTLVEPPARAVAAGTRLAASVASRTRRGVNSDIGKTLRTRRAGGSIELIRRQRAGEQESLAE